MLGDGRRSSKFTRPRGFAGRCWDKPFGAGSADLIITLAAAESAPRTRPTRMARGVCPGFVRLGCRKAAALLGRHVFIRKCASVVGRQFLDLYLCFCFVFSARGFRFGKTAWRSPYELLQQDIKNYGSIFTRNVNEG